MIITRLIGGLGNQLFQYAIGRALAIRNNDVLKLDVSGFETYKLHAYSLGAFNIVENFSVPEETDLFFPRNVFARLKMKRGNYRVLVDQKKGADTSILDKNGHLYLDGSWQSEKYFKDIRETILQEFAVRADITEDNRFVADQMATVNAVSLHVRRGDYVSDHKTNQFHGTCDLVYYQRAIEHIAERVDVPHFFVFSDDPQWTRENLKIPFLKTFVTHNDAKTNYEDLRLMSFCKHSIIANSTFSWWGAWLNRNPFKIVIAPRKWFNSNTLDTKDLIPSAWVQL